MIRSKLSDTCKKNLAGVPSAALKDYSHQDWRESRAVRKKNRLKIK
jgi:hypothetical protein